MVPKFRFPTKHYLSLLIDMSTAHLTAIDLLKRGDEDREIPWLNKYWPQILGVTFGFATGVAINFGTRRPVFSGIQKHLIATAVWTGGLYYAHRKREDYYAEKDAVLRHYIELHPEDFPQPERKLIGDILEPWIPVR